MEALAHKLADLSVSDAVILVVRPWLAARRTGWEERVNRDEEVWPDAW